MELRVSGSSSGVEKIPLNLVITYVRPINVTYSGHKGSNRCFVLFVRRATYGYPRAGELRHWTPITTSLAVSLPPSRCLLDGITRWRAAIVLFILNSSPLFNLFFCPSTFLISLAAVLTVPDPHLHACSHNPKSFHHSFNPVTPSGSTRPRNAERSPGPRPPGLPRRNPHHTHHAAPPCPPPGFGPGCFCFVLLFPLQILGQQRRRPRRRG